MVEIEDRAFINMVCSLVACMFGIPGNALILRFFTNSNKGRTNTTNKITTYHLCIVHLAVADFLTCTLSPVWSIYQYINYVVVKTRIEGSLKLVFNFIFIIFFVANMASSGISFTLSVERYLKISSPFVTKMKRPMIHVMCAGFYLSSILAVFPTDFVIKDDINTELILNTIFYTIGVIVLLVVPVIGTWIMYAKTKTIIAKQNISQDSIHGSARMRNSHQAAVNTLRSLTIVMVLTIGIPKMFLSVLYGIVLTEKRSIRDGLTLDSDAVKVAFVVGNNVIYFRNTVTAFIYFKYVKEFRAFVNSLFGRSSRLTN